MYNSKLRVIITCYIATSRRALLVGQIYKRFHVAHTAQYRLASIAFQDFKTIVFNYGLQKLFFLNMTIMSC